MELEKQEIELIIKDKIDNYTKQFGKTFKLALIEVLSLEKLLNPVQPKKEEARLIPVSKWNEYYPDPSVKAMQMLVFRKQENGFEEFGVVEKRGNRNLINVDNYNKWRKSRG